MLNHQTLLTLASSCASAPLLSRQAAATGAFTQTVTIPATAVGKVIGKAGSTIRDLQDRFDCKVNVPKVAPGSTAAVEVKVSGGDKSNIQAAIVEIQALAAASAQVRAPRAEGRPERAERPSFIKGSVPVPQSAVGRVIGRGGETIRDLQASSGCRINVPSSPDSSDGKVLVQVSGPSKDAVDDVIARITALTVAPAPGGARGAGRDREVSAAAAPATTGTVEIDSAVVGRVIGKGGLVIRGLQDKYSVQIKVPKSASETVVVTVGGGDDASVQAAIDEINALVAPRDVSVSHR